MLAASNSLSRKEYLELDAQSDTKHEYLDTYPDLSIYCDEAGLTLEAIKTELSLTEVYRSLERA